MLYIKDFIDFKSCFECFKQKLDKLKCYSKGLKIMKFKRIMLITLLLLAIFTIGAISAADNMTDEGVLEENTSDELELNDNANEYIVSSEQDEIIGATDDRTFTALQKKINDAPDGSTITLENDYVYDDGFDTNGIEITKQITINGNGHTINALSKSKIFLVKSNSVFNNIKFVNGYSYFGAAIDVEYGETRQGYNIIPVYYDVTINNCNFQNNVAERCGGAIGVADNSKVNIFNSVFTQCSADYYGGAIYGGHINVANSVFTNNKANQEGGAIHANLKSEIKGCEFNSNSAKFDGGAIYYYSSNDFDELYVNNCKFTGNKAKDSGGAIRSKYDMNVENSIFKNNEANTGGAIDCACEISTTIKNSEFLNNKAYDRGGAIFGIYDVKASDCIFEKNSAKEGTALWGVKPIKCTFKGSKSTDANLIIGETPENCKFDKPITKLTPKLTAKKATFKAKTKTKKYTATLKTNKNKAMKKVKLYLKVKGKTITAKTNSKGKATFKIKNLKKKGTYKATITFKGNNNYNKVSKTVKIKVK